MKYKPFWLFTVIFLVLFISPVSAGLNDFCSGSNRDTVSEIEDAQSGIIYVDPVKGDDGGDGSKNYPKKTLKEGLKVAPEGATITLSPNSIFNESWIIIDKDVTICGNGAVIDGKGNGRILEVKNDKFLKLENLTIQNGKVGFFSYGGAGLYVGKGCKILIHNSNFINNNANRDSGGAIYNEGAKYFKITNSNFKSNSATYGGAIYNGGNAVVEMWRCTFTKNNVNLEAPYGGAIYNEKDSELLIKYCNFNENEANGGGDGIIYNNAGIINIFSTAFSYNGADNEAGAIYNFFGRLNIKNSLFDSNYAKYNGGAIVSYKGDLNLENTEFKDNKIIGKRAYRGGAIYHLHNALTIKNCYFGGNYANGDGGAIYTHYANVNIDNTRFLWNGEYDNHFTYKGGAVFIEGTDKQVKITKSKFESCKAWDGAGIYAKWTKLRLEDCYFYDNAVINFGGATFLEGTDKDLSGNIFIRNRNNRGEEDNIFSK